MLLTHHTLPPPDWTGPVLPWTRTHRWLVRLLETLPARGKPAEEVLKYWTRHLIAFIEENQMNVTRIALSDLIAIPAYDNIVLSMKASNPQVMIQAYRLLVQKLVEEGFQPYPLHLGVTEAGDGEDGRVKSSVGIGTLLEDGLGDTIRVSLTEEPEGEVPVCKELLSRYTHRLPHDPIPEITKNPIDPVAYTRRPTREVLNIGGHQVPRVVADFSLKQSVSAASLFAVGYQYSVPLDKWHITDAACDYVILGDNVIDFHTPGTLGLIYNQPTWASRKEQARCYPFIHAKSTCAGWSGRPG